jgi:hypothetical protein
MNSLPLSLGLIAMLFSTGTALAQSRAMELTNDSADTVGYARIAHDARLTPQQFTLEARITPLGRGYQASNQLGAMFLSKPREGSGGRFIQAFGFAWSPTTERLRAIIARQQGSGGKEVYSSSVVPLGETRHVAMTFDGSWLRIYIDGKLDAEGEAGFSVIDYEDNPLLIGAGNFVSGSRRRFQGRIDEVRLWDHARTKEQLAYSDDCLLEGDEPGLLAYYSFDNEDITDDSGNGHDGIVEGTATFVSNLLPCVLFKDSYEEVAVP